MLTLVISSRVDRPPASGILAWGRNGVVRIRPPDARQVMECDADAPAVPRRDDDEQQHHREGDEGEGGIAASETEVDDGDDPRDRQAITEDGERPGVALITFVDEAAGAAAVEMFAPGEQRTASAVRAS